MVIILHTRFQLVYWFRRYKKVIWDERQGTMSRPAEKA